MKVNFISVYYSWNQLSTLCRACVMSTFWLLSFPPSHLEVRNFLQCLILCLDFLVKQAFSNATEWISRLRSSWGFPNQTGRWNLTKPRENRKKNGFWHCSIDLLLLMASGMCSHLWPQVVHFPPCAILPISPGTTNSQQLAQMKHRWLV